MNPSNPPPSPFDRPVRPEPPPLGPLRAAFPLPAHYIPEPPPLYADDLADLRAALVYRDGSRSEPRRRRGRRWPFLLLGLVGVAIAFFGAAGGGSRATADDAAQAAQLAQRGDYASAIAIDYKIASLGGPLLIFDRSDVSGASLSAERVMLAWAEALAAAGKVDQAVALIDSVTDPILRIAAGKERSSLLLRAADAAAKKRDYATAVRRLQEIVTRDPGSDSAKQAAAQLPADQIGEATVLVAGGHAADAVSLLDSVVATAPAAAQQQAAGVYPAALVAAAKEEIIQSSYKEALASVQRVLDHYGGSPEASEAWTLMRASQPVSGTLVDRNGQPISGRVRLSSHFTAVPGGYFTSGPFYPSLADTNGDFVVDTVPIGGPYVLEVFHGGNWTTLVDPSTGQPSDPVTVAPLQPTSLTFVVLP